MAKEPDKPRARTILTGAAQPVSNSVERARAYLKDRPGPSSPPSRRKAARKRPLEIVEESPPEGDTAELEGEELPKGLPED
jgi:hypothetical protein